MEGATMGSGEWKPNLFVPGFPKCGTTALCDYLRQNPDIYVMHPKEPQTVAIGIEVPAWAKKHHRIVRPYFRYLTPGEYEEELRRHARFRYRVDGSQSYIWPPHFPTRLKRFAPEAKLIFMIREQKERLLSLYAHGFSNHLEPHFGKWLEERFLPQLEPFLFMGMLSSYYRLFRGSMRVVDNAALLASPEEVMGAAFEFLGVRGIRVEPLRSNVGGLKALDEYQRTRAAPMLRLTRGVLTPARYFLNVADPGGRSGWRRYTRRVNPMRRVGGRIRGGKASARPGPGRGGEGVGSIPPGLASRLDGDYESSLRFCREKGLMLGPS